MRAIPAAMAAIAVSTLALAGAHAEDGPILQSLRDQPPAQVGGGNLPAPQPASPGGGGQVLAQGAGGALTEDGVAAYIEALEFCLNQVGQPTQFDAQTRAQIAQAMVQSYPNLAIEDQQGLAQARAIWTEYAQGWGQLPVDEKREFAYAILALAYGEQMASQAVGYDQGGGGGGAGGGEAYYPEVNAPGTTDCWASAGCTGYDGATDSYSYETYDYD